MTLILLAVFACVAWITSIAAAGGAAIIFIPLASLVIPTTIIPPVLSVAGTISGVHRTWIYRSEINWKIVIWMLPGTIVGALLGAYLFSFLHSVTIEVLVGLFLVSVSLLHLLKITLVKRSLPFLVFLPASFCTSLISALVGLLVLFSMLFT